MTNEQREAIIEAEVDRVTQQVRKHLTKTFDIYDKDTLRVEHAFVGFILLFEDEDGDVHEGTSTTCTSASRTIQDGMLVRMARHHDMNMRDQL